jgi:hypothetical protein
MQVTIVVLAGWPDRIAKAKVVQLSSDTAVMTGRLLNLQQGKFTV